MHVEGDTWNAYFKTNDNSKTLLLGSINIAMIVNNSKRKEEFFLLMQNCLSESIKDILGPAVNDVQMISSDKKNIQ